MLSIAKCLGRPSWIVALTIASLVVWAHQMRPTGEPPPVAWAPGETAAAARTVSADGRFRVFQSSHVHTAGDTNDRVDVFVEDVRTGAVRLVSTNPAGGPGDGDSTDPSISADGRYVAFRSTAGNLVAADTNREADIFVRDLATGATTRVSTDTAGREGDGSSGLPSISANGRYVTFHSSSGNLVAGARGGRGIFVKDLVTGATSRVGDFGRVPKFP